MTADKVLALVTASEATKNELCGQLGSLLDGYIKVEGYATEAGISDTVRADLIVLSSRMMVEEAKDFIDSGCPTIIASRALNLKNIDKLFFVPNGSAVMLVNDEMENAVEVIKLLREIGVDYLNYIPYAPGYPIDKSVKIAITPGEVALVPEHVDEIIDLGARVIDIATIIEILVKLGLLDEKSHFITAKYMETIVRLNKQLHDSIRESENMNRYLVKVLDRVNDGIIAFSDNGVISVFNDRSEMLFGIRSANAVGRNISQVIRDKAVCDYLLSSPDNLDQLFRLGDTDIIISRFYIEKQRSIVCTIKDAKATIDMEKKLRQRLLKKGLIGKYHFEDIVGSSAIMRRTVETAQKLARADLSILITGESGVGKELFASAIHNSSKRSNGPFLAVNFSALPEELAESELFGYEEGAFTGARKGGQIGLFEQANGGTIFLDEIGDISLRIQARLLRVLQEKEIRKVGGTEIVPVNVRVIAATNRNLVQMCRSGLFREDLYHRLRKLYIEIPPLRDRIEDIDELIEHFIRIGGEPKLVLSEEVKRILGSVPWTGNVRELENTVDYFRAVAEDGIVDAADLPRDFFEMHHGETWTDEDRFSEELEKRGVLEDCLLILRTIRENTASGIGTGREAVADSAADKGFEKMTPDKIRRRAEILFDLGLIVKGPGRGGMKLTRRGREFLRLRD